MINGQSQHVPAAITPVFGDHGFSRWPVVFRYQIPDQANP